MFRHLRKSARGSGYPLFGVPLRLNRKHPLYSSIAACVVPHWGHGLVAAIDLVTMQVSDNTAWPTPVGTYMSSGDRRFITAYRHVISIDARRRPTGAYTLSSLVQTLGGVAGTGFQPFIGVWDPDYNGGIIIGRAYSTDYYLRGGFWNGSAQQSVDTTVNVLDGYAHGHAHTYDGIDTLTAYKNGVSVQAATVSGSPTYGGNPRLWFMANQFDSNYINAESAIGIVFNRCLSPAEIYALHAAHMGPVEPDFGDVAYYDAPSGGGTTYNESITFTATMGASQSVAVTFMPTRTEIAAMAMQLAAAVTFAPARSEAATMGAAQSAAVVFQPARAEVATMGAAQSGAATMNPSRTETATLSVSQAAIAAMNAARTETATMGMSVFDPLAVSATANDSVQPGFPGRLLRVQ